MADTDKAILTVAQVKRIAEMVRWWENWGGKDNSANERKFVTAYTLGGNRVRRVRCIVSSGTAGPPCTFVYTVQDFVTGETLPQPGPSEPFLARRSGRKMIAATKGWIFNDPASGWVLMDTDEQPAGQVCAS